MTALQPLPQHPTVQTITAAVQTVTIPQPVQRTVTTVQAVQTIIL